MSQEVNGGQPKLPLSWVDDKAVLAETLKKDPQVGKVLCFGSAGRGIHGQGPPYLPGMLKNPGCEALDSDLVL